MYVCKDSAAPAHRVIVIVSVCVLETGVLRRGEGVWSACWQTKFIKYKMVYSPTHNRAQITVFIKNKIIMCMHVHMTDMYMSCGVAYGLLCLWLSCGCVGRAQRTHCIIE